MLAMSGRMYSQVWAMIAFLVVHFHYKESHFIGECPNNIDGAAKICVKYATKDRPENAVLSAAKW